jgi:NAD(P)-dependent dehydrogenase (short-subunit alcohol dehydrogenase family)
VSSEKLCAIVGAGPGLSQAIASRFGREGYSIALIARRSETLAGYTQELAAEGIEAKGFVGDAGDNGSLVNAFAQIRQSLGHPGVLIYNAAALKTGGPLQLSAEDLVQDFRVNVAGALTAVQQVVIPMQSRKQGTILLTGGGLGLDPYPDYLSLSLGKAAIRNLALSLAKSFEPDGIHVATVTICGFIQPGTHFAPDLLAQEYWALHAQAPGSWQREEIYQ